MLTEKQAQCLEMMLTTNKTQKDIAFILGVSEPTITSWKKNEEFVNEFNQAIRDGIKSSAAKAYQAMEKLLSSKNENIRYAAAKDILDRSGFRPDAKLNITGTIAAATKLDKIIEQLNGDADEC